MTKTLLRKLWLSNEFSDSEIVASILEKHGYQTTRNYEESNLILLTHVLLEKRPNLVLEIDLNLLMNLNVIIQV